MGPFMVTTREENSGAPAGSSELLQLFFKSCLEWGHYLQFWCDASVGIWFPWPLAH